MSDPYQTSIRNFWRQIPAQCPGCSGHGRQVTSDPLVLKCDGCGGVFTDWRYPVTRARALAFVRFDLPMLATAGADGQFYFDFSLANEYRTHGWADTATKRVVQYG